jgi:hypothetical protein
MSVGHVNVEGHVNVDDGRLGDGRMSVVMTVEIVMPPGTVTGRALVLRLDVST